MTRKTLVGVAVIAVGLSGAVFAQNPAALITKAEVEKATGTSFKDGWAPMKEQVQFDQAGGDMQVSLEVEPREAGATVRTWAATMKKMQPSLAVDTVPGLGSDAIVYSTRPDLAKVSFDVEKPRVQVSVSVSGAKTPAKARQIVIDLAKLAAARAVK
jgi:hypothetical protein